MFPRLRVGLLLVGCSALRLFIRATQVYHSLGRDFLEFLLFGSEEGKFLSVILNLAALRDIGVERFEVFGVSLLALWGDEE